MFLHISVDVLVQHSAKMPTLGLDTDQLGFSFPCSCLASSVTDKQLSSYRT